MKVIILGAKGMLGGALVEVFSENHEVLAWDRNDFDITEYAKSKIKIEEYKPKLLINAVAYNDVDRAESESKIAEMVNGYAVGNLAKICKQLDIPLVHYSTDYVFDGKKKEGYAEADKPNPISAYGRSKYLGELELVENTDMYYLVRLSKLFGKVGSGKMSFVQLMIDLSQDRQSLDVVDEEVSSPTYALDLARQTKHIVESKQEYGIYHCTNAGTVTWFEFAKKIFQLKNIETELKAVKSSHFPRPAKRPKYGILKNTKLKPLRSWEEALADFLMTLDK